MVEMMSRCGLLNHRPVTLAAVAGCVASLAFVLVATRPLAAQQLSGGDAAAASAPFSIELEPQEIITTDLKRMVLQGCGKVTFSVQDAGLVGLLGPKLVAESAKLAVISARRAVLAGKSSIEIRDRADVVRDDIRRAVDAIMKDRGVAVAEMAGDLRICAVPVPPPK
jgi:hypothetical protein